MTDTSRRVCDHCGAPLRDLVDGYCPFCRTRPFAAPGAPVVSATAFSVLLLDAGRSKIEVIRQLRLLVDQDFGTDLGLKEAKDIVDRAHPGSPPALIVDVDATQAQRWADTFTRAGASVAIRGTGVSSADPAAADPTAPGSVGPASTTYGVYLLECGKKKINVIKEIRGISGAGLAAAKDIADRANGSPQLVAAGLDEHDARTAAARLSNAGAIADIRLL